MGSWFVPAPRLTGRFVVTVQRALGHSSTSITLTTYSHLWPSGEERTRQAASALACEILSADPVNDSEVGSRGDQTASDAG